VMTTAFVVIFLAEWGDLTQILTANLAAHYHSPFSVGLGALLALWTVAGLAVVGGQSLLRFINIKTVRLVTAVVLLAIPVLWGWRSIFAKSRGKALTIVYFACLGAGYIMVEVGLIAHFVMALGNPTISASILITGMLVFSGLGALTSERVLPAMRVVMPVIFLAIGALLIAYALFLNYALDAIGALPYLARLLCCFVFIAPPAYLMGFPMPTAMTTLGRLGKEHLFIWAWGVNGCFSVIGAAAAPVIATNFGLGAVIEIAGLAYLVALPSFFGVILGAAPSRSA